MENMLEAVQRLTRVTDQLLRLARLERTEVQATFHPLDAGVVVRETAELFQPLCEEKGIVFRVEVQGELRVLGHEDLLMEMLANLLDNALRVTPNGGEILLRAGALAPTRPRNWSRRVPVASRILASDSVEGHRGRPLLAARFDLLKVVASSPARRASPDGLRPWALASASIAPQT